MALHSRQEIYLFASVSQSTHVNKFNRPHASGVVPQRIFLENEKFITLS